MASFSPLPADLIKVLTRFKDSFETTAARFRQSLVNDNEVDLSFIRVCEIHNTLDLLSESETPLALLAQLQGTSRDASSNPREAAEGYLSFTLNAEFVLYDLYHEHSIGLNPSLSHWVSACRNSTWSPVQNGDRDPWDIGQRVAQIQVALMRGILSENAPKLAGISPEAFAARGMDYDVELENFRDALSAQGIEEADLAKAPPTTTGSTNEVATGQAEDGFREVQEYLSAIIAQGTTEELNSELSKQLLAHIASNSQLFYSLPADILSTSTLHKLFAANPNFARGITSLFLSKGDADQRRDVIMALESLPITLAKLDMLNDLISKKTLLRPEEASHLLHNTLENGIRAAEKLGLSEGGPKVLESPGYVFAEGHRASHVTANTVIREAQGRQIQLLCVFIQGLLRDDAVELQEVFYQIQDMGIKFMFVKEARELWRSYCVG